MPTSTRIIATGITKLIKSKESAIALKQRALEIAVASVSGLRIEHLDGLITLPSLSETRFMDAHFLATRMNLLPNKSRNGMMVKTLDTGGAGPVTALLEAHKLIQHGGYSVVAIVAGDAVASMSTEDFLKEADAGCSDPEGDSSRPVIPNGYNRVAEWMIAEGRVTREQLAMVSVLMSRQAIRHPHALTRIPHTLEKVLMSASVASVTTQLECARRADGAAAVIVASQQFITDHQLVLPKSISRCPVILGGGEASGPLYPPRIITQDMFSCEKAAMKAYESTGLTVSDIDYFGLYDCFPICFIKAVEDVGLAPKGLGGQWVEDRYLQSEAQGGVLSPSEFPVNTHGGLLSFGAPWETPAMHSIVEAVFQLSDLSEPEAGVSNSNNDLDSIEERKFQMQRQVPHTKHALVYGNGGIFSASAVAILGRAE